MSPEQEKIMETLSELFNHPGWVIFQEDIEKNLLSLQVGAYDPDESKEFFKNKGKVASLLFVQNYQTMIDHSYKQLLEQESDDDI